MTRSEAGTVMIPPSKVDNTWQRTKDPQRSHFSQVPDTKRDVIFFSILAMYKFAYFVQEKPTSVKDAFRYVCNHES